MPNFPHITPGAKCPNCEAEDVSKDPPRRAYSCGSTYDPSTKKFTRKCELSRAQWIEQFKKKRRRALP